MGEEQGNGGERDARAEEVAAFREGAEALPPLTERIPAGPEGEDEFRRLIHQLLLVHAERNRALYFPAGGGSYTGVDGIARDGIPGLEGVVAFRFMCLSGDLREGGDAVRIENAAHLASSDKTLTHWVLVTPRDLKLFERAWLDALKPRRGLQVHHWGLARIEQLLRQCPALLARYYPQAARAYLPGYDGADFHAFAAHYREKVALRWRSLKTIGLPLDALREQQARTELRLRDLFIPLRLVPERAGANAVGLAQVLREHRSVVILGDPGMGKSTLLAYIALVFAGGAALEGFTPPAEILPLHISLRDYVDLQKKDPDLSLLVYLETRARTDHQLHDAHLAFFEAVLRMGEAVLLFDGLDEVGNEAARLRVARQIRTFRASYPDCSFWVTSRIYGYVPSIRFPADELAHHRIDTLDLQAIRGFIERFYAVQIPDNLREREERTASLGLAVERTPSVRRLAGNPLLLTLTAFIHHGLRSLPQDRGELYEQCVEMLLKTWLEAKHEERDAARAAARIELRVSEQKDYLAHLALFVQEKGSDTGERGLVSRREALECLTARHLRVSERSRPDLSEHVAREEMGHFLDYIGDATGLLVDRGNDRLSFIHLSFQEYLAAWVFTCGPRPARPAAFFEDHIGDPAWEEVLLLRLYVMRWQPGGGGADDVDAAVGALLRKLRDGGSADAWLTLARALRDDLDFRPEDQRAILNKAVGFWLEAPAFEGTWFAALEEVHRFGRRARGKLQEVLAERRAPGCKPLEAVACLHLETALFGFPTEAADGLRTRPDLRELLSDLVAFAGEPGIDALLGDNARAADWSRALQALDGPELYRKTLRWAVAPPTPEAAYAATALLWEKIFTDLRSRAAFAAPRCQHEHAVLFERPGVVVCRTPFSSAALPYTAIRVLPATIPPGTPPSLAALLCPTLALARLRDTAANLWSELLAWTAEWIASKVDRFRATKPLDPPDTRALAATFVRSFVRDLDQFFVDDFVDDWARSLGRDFVRNFSRDFCRCLLGCFGRAFVSDFGRDFIRSFGRDFGGEFSRSIVHDFIRSFGRDFALSFGSDFGIDPHELAWVAAWDRVMEDESNRLRLLECKDFWWMALRWAAGADADWKIGVSTSDLRLLNPLALPMLLADIWSAAGNHMAIVSARQVAAAYPKGDIPDGALKASLLRNSIKVYATAFAWQEHCKPITHISGPAGALFVAHAAYATLMTGIECKLPVDPDLTDPRVRVSHILYELCNFRDAELNVRRLEAKIAAPAPELRPLLEACGLISATGSAGNISSQPTTAAAPAPQPKPDKPALFTWLHLSDINLGHPSATQHWDQALVLDALHKDIAEHGARGVPTPTAILITGDIAHSGAAPQYDLARSWLDKLAALLKIAPDRIFLVPGNHDIDRTADTTNRNAGRLLRLLRGGEPLDEALADPEDKALLISRLAPYLAFASAYLGKADPLCWTRTLTSNGLPVHLIGLTTPLLAADDVDKGKLRLGNAALAATLTDLPADHLTLVLTHHPLRGGWLADQREADGWIQGRAHIHLFGHVHEHDSEDARSGAGTGLLRIAAGATYGDRPGVPASHGYSVAAVVPQHDGTLRLRIWPRRWSETKRFVADVHNTPEGRAYAEHPLPRLRVAG